VAVLIGALVLAASGDGLMIAVVGIALGIATLSMADDLAAKQARLSSGTFGRRKRTPPTLGEIRAWRLVYRGSGYLLIVASVVGASSQSCRDPRRQRCP
jgi:hypothetical protein